MGSPLQEKISQYLGSFVNQNTTVFDLLRSTSNQSQTKEIKVALLGPGQIFGETDLINNRSYSYSLRSKSYNAEVYMISKIEFMRLVEENQCN